MEYRHALMPIPPDELEAEAARLERECAAQVLAGNRELAEKLARQADALRSLGEGRQLRPVDESRTVHSVLSADHKAALSESQGGHAKKFLKWIRDKEHGRWSMNGLAKAVPMAPSSISQAQRRKSDPLSRPIRQDRAERIQQLTGWPADPDHWPGGILDE